MRGLRSETVVLVMANFSQPVNIHKLRSLCKHNNKFCPFDQDSSGLFWFISTSLAASSAQIGSCTAGANAESCAKLNPKLIGCEGPVNGSCGFACIFSSFSNLSCRLLFFSKGVETYQFALLSTDISDTYLRQHLLNSNIFTLKCAEGYKWIFGCNCECVIADSFSLDNTRKSSGK